jgi:hypothetical protein
MGGGTCHIPWRYPVSPLETTGLMEATWEVGSAAHNGSAIGPGVLEIPSVIPRRIAFLRPAYAFVYRGVV